MAWCSHHDDGAGAWVPREEFGRCGERGIQKYCRACRSEYMKNWRRTGKPAKERAAYEKAYNDLQEAKNDQLEFLASKYAER